MKLENEYQNAKNLYLTVRELLAKEWVYQQISCENLPSENQRKAVEELVRKFDLEATQAASIIMECIDQAKVMDESIRRFKLNSN